MARYIDADALIADVTERCCKDCNKRKGMKNGKLRTIYEIGELPCRSCDVDDMKYELDYAPTVDAVPVVHGKWVFSENDDMFYCTNCKNGSVRNDYPYCHWCGAVMDGEKVTE